jgi:hypothetical protein
MLVTNYGFGGYVSPKARVRVGMISMGLGRRLEAAGFDACAKQDVFRELGSTGACTYHHEQY